MTQTEALKLALEALNTNRVMAKDSDGNYTREITPKLIVEAIRAIKEALAQPEQEPVACPHCNDGRDVPDGETCNECGFTHLPYGSTTPPASKPWVWLTDEEYGSMYNTYLRKGGPIQNFTRAIEAKLKEKNT